MEENVHSQNTAKLGCGYTVCVENKSVSKWLEIKILTSSERGPVDAALPQANSQRRGGPIATFVSQPQILGYCLSSGFFGMYPASTPRL
jgi:hypothetical protein